MNTQKVIDFNEKGRSRMYNEGTAAKKRKRDNLEFVMNYSDAMDIHEEERKRRHRRMQKNMEKKIKYYARQRAMGIGVILMGAGLMASTKIIPVDLISYLGGVVGLLGIYIFMTKNMVLVDRYYLECQERLNEC